MNKNHNSVSIYMYRKYNYTNVAASIQSLARTFRLTTEMPPQRAMQLLQNVNIMSANSLL